MTEKPRLRVVLPSRAKAISEVIKEVFVALTSILLIIGSFAQGFNMFTPVKQDSKANVKEEVDPLLRSYLLEAPEEYFGVAVWSFSDDLAYLSLVGYRSVKRVNMKGVALRGTDEPGFKPSLEILKNGRCHTILTKDLPFGDSERSLMEVHGILGVMRCPLFSDGELVGMVSGSWISPEVDLDQLRFHLIKLTGRVETTVHLR